MRRFISLVLGIGALAIATPGCMGADPPARTGKAAKTEFAAVELAPGQTHLASARLCHSEVHADTGGGVHAELRPITPFSGVVLVSLANAGDPPGPIAVRDEQLATLALGYLEVLGEEPCGQWLELSVHWDSDRTEPLQFEWRFEFEGSSDVAEDLVVLEVRP